ncbi:hypothetical protein B0H17DRAFT_1098292, partial [Mycena rosella]
MPRVISSLSSLSPWLGVLLPSAKPPAAGRRNSRGLRTACDVRSTVSFRSPHLY